MLLNQFLSYGKAEEAPGQARAGPSSHVDPQRMMAVWEAFFENAMKRMMAEESAAAGSGLMLDSTGYQIAASSMLSAIDDSDLNHSPSNNRVSPLSTVRTIPVH